MITAAASRPSHTRQRALKSALFQCVCILLGLMLMLPLVYCATVSLMPEREIVSQSPHFFPLTPSLQNYREVIGGTGIFRFMYNSLVVALVCSISRVITASMAAYAFAFYEFRFKKLLFALVLGTMIIPAEMLMVQNYFTTAELGLINTYAGMTVIYLVSPANVFLLRQNFRTYSLSVREASQVDGCGTIRFFFKILLPMSMPVLATVFISSFVTSWNTYLWPMLVTNVESMRTVQVIITMLNASEINTSYGQVMAAAMLILIPSLLVFILFQRRITAGMMAGAVKE